MAAVSVARMSVYFGVLSSWSSEGRLGIRCSPCVSCEDIHYVSSLTWVRISLQDEKIKQNSCYLAIFLTLAENVWSSSMTSCKSLPFILIGLPHPQTWLPSRRRTQSSDLPLQQ